MMLRALLLALGVFASTPLAAQTYEFAVEGNFSTTGNPEISSERAATVNYDLAAELRMGLLMGEPVISLRLRYDLLGGIVTLPTFEPGEDRYETLRLGLLPSEAFDTVRLHSARLRFTFDSGTGDSVEVVADAGYLDRSGAWSFNVPGSPDWDRVFIVPSSTFLDGEPTFYGEDAARAIWRSGLTLAAVEMEDIRLSLHYLHNWYASNNQISRLRTARRALALLERGVTVSYGYQAGDGFDAALDGSDSVAAQLESALTGNNLLGHTDYDGDEWLHVLSRAIDRFNRLAQLPDALRIGDNHRPYQTARAEAIRMFELNAELVADFEPEGLRPDSLPIGAPPPDFDRDPASSEASGLSAGLQLQTEGPAPPTGSTHAIVGTMVSPQLGQPIPRLGDREQWSPGRPDGYVLTTVFIAQTFSMRGNCWVPGGFMIGQVASEVGARRAETFRQAREQSNAERAAGNNPQQVLAFSSLSEGISYHRQNARNYTLSLSEARRIGAQCSGSDFGTQPEIVYPEPVTASGY
jgi:hypothetical protein